jgi:hypothetical protein
MNENAKLIEAENELICEKVLGWTKLRPAGRDPAYPAIWQGPADNRGISRGGMLTPTFQDAGDVATLFEALRARGVHHWTIYYDASNGWTVTSKFIHRGPFIKSTLQLALRQAALAWIAWQPRV